MDEDKLSSTNRLLGDLQRKLSLISSTSNQSNNSSVIINPNLNSNTKRSINSQVLQYMKQDELNLQDIYHDRVIQNSKRQNADDTIEIITIDDDDDDEGEAEDDEDDDVSTSYHGSTSSENYYYDVDEDEDEDKDDEEDYDYDYDDEDEDFGMLPPSPPRSPPTELEPDKLYGLYDFSGPDPSHLQIERNEPVYLINDQDDYWWLIRKLTKEEKALKKKKLVELAKSRNEFLSDIESIASTSDDGKIGFVPAECLETYDERLARYNCFKNEEIERFHKNPFDFDVHESMQFQNLDQFHPLPNIDIKKKSNNKRKKNVSFSHTDLFEDDDINESDENDLKNDLSIIRQQQLQGFNHDINHDDLNNDNSQNLLKPPGLDQDNDKTSEVLSDIYPDKIPLIVKKSNQKSKSYSPNISVKKYSNSQESSPTRSASSVQKSSPSKDISQESIRENSFYSQDDSQDVFIVDTNSNNKSEKVSDKPFVSLSTGLRNSLGKINDKLDKRSSLTSKIMTATHGDLKHSNSLSKDYKDKLEHNKKIPFRKVSSSGKRIVNKDNGKLKTDRNDYPKFYKPIMPRAQNNSNTNDDSSIGSYSPDTPPLRNSGKFETSPESVKPEISNSLTQLRRSVILDRLTKMTFDIQEQLDDYESESNTSQSQNVVEDSIISESTIKSENSQKSKTEIKPEHLDQMKEPRREVKELNLERDGSKRSIRTGSRRRESSDGSFSIFSKAGNDNGSISIDRRSSETSDLKQDQKIDPSFNPRPNGKRASFLRKDSMASTSSKLSDSYISLRKDSVTSSKIEPNTSTIGDSSFINNSSILDPDTSMNSQKSKISNSKGNNIRNYNTATTSRSYNMTNTNTSNTKENIMTTFIADIDTTNDNSNNNSIIDNSNTNTIKNSFTNNTSKDSFNSNTIKDSFNSNTIKDSSNTNTIKESSNTNTIKDSPNTNTVNKSFNTNATPLTGDTSATNPNTTITGLDYEYYELDDDLLPNHGDYTPLTSINSLPHSTPTTKIQTSFDTLADKRKSKPVHDMFLPILGKFDELAEKLAALDDLI